MSGNPSIAGLPVPTRALWTWSTPTLGMEPSVQGFPTVPGAPTKSGLVRADLESYMQTIIQQNSMPIVPISDATVNGWIRMAEDDIETKTGVRLCQTWIAAPAAKSLVQKQSVNLDTVGFTQQLGVDYDYEEAGYDFIFERWRDEGWGYMRLRARPVKSVSYFDPTAIVGSNAHGIKNVAFIYPLLNQYFRMPDSWQVEDQNRGLVRFVPATSVQMLPLFSMQLAFMGFAQSVPQGMWFQYTAGLTRADYQSDWSFMKQLVLATASIIAWGAMQTSVNMGAYEIQTTADGLSQRVRYGDKGVFFAQITMQQSVVKDLTSRAKSKAGGFHMGML